MPPESCTVKSSRFSPVPRAQSRDMARARRIEFRTDIFHCPSNRISSEPKSLSHAPKRPTRIAPIPASGIDACGVKSNLATPAETEQIKQKLQNSRRDH